MAFDWQRFFDQNSIEYATSGSNVSRGNVATHCPWCGAEDEGMHLSVSLEGRGFRCFRRPDHRGKNPARLVMVLLGCTWSRACAIVGQSINIPDDFMGAVTKAMTPELVDVKPRKLKLPESFKPFKKLPSARPFIRYMRDRGFVDQEIMMMTDWYGLRYTTGGPYAYRIIFPVRFEHKLVTWTGRAINKQAEIRYKTLSDDAERAEYEGVGQALGPISDYLLWYDKLLTRDADTIALCEGPFDALKVDVLGYHEGVCATCFFTSAPTQAQVSLLHELLPRFKRRLLFLDKGTMPTAIKTQSNLTGLDVRMREMPSGLKDPGELRTAKQLRAICWG